MSGTKKQSCEPCSRLPVLRRTLDLGVVCRRGDGNLRRLAELPEGLEARYRDPADSPCAT
jgi:hypothetical protein